MGLFPGKANLRSSLIASLVLVQPGSAPRVSVLAEASLAPRRNIRIVYYDERFLFVARDFGEARDVGGNTTPGLFVHSRQHDRWIRVVQISTAGGQFGRSSSDDPDEQRKLRAASVGWDFSRYASALYIEQPLRTIGGAIAFPEQVSYKAASDSYQLRYFTSWGVASAETVLYVKRADLMDAFDKGR